MSADANKQVVRNFFQDLTEGDEYLDTVLVDRIWAR